MIEPDNGYQMYSDALIADPKRNKPQMTDDESQGRGRSRGIGRNQAESSGVKNSFEYAVPSPMNDPNAAMQRHKFDEERMLIEQDPFLLEE